MGLSAGPPSCWTTLFPFSLSLSSLSHSLIFPLPIAPWPFLLHVFFTYASPAPCVSTLGPCVSRASAPTLFTPLFHNPRWPVIWTLRHPWFFCSLHLLHPLYISAFFSWHQKTCLPCKLFPISVNLTNFLSFAALFRKQIVQAKSGACICRLDSGWFFCLLTLTY